METNTDFVKGVVEAFIEGELPHMKETVLEPNWVAGGGLAPGLNSSGLDWRDESQPKVDLLNYVSNHGLSQLAALIGISLGNTDTK